MTARISDASSTQQSSSSKPTVRFNGPPSQEIELMFLMSGLRKGGDRVSTSADMSPRSSTMEDEPIAASDDVQRWLERMPAHWRAPDSSMLRHTFASSCSTALKQPDLTELWVACRDEESFQVYRDSLMKRTLIITVVGTLLTIPLGMLVTTNAPRPEIINYDMRGPHIMLFNSFATILVTVVVSLSIVYTLSDVTRGKFIHTYMRTRTHVWSFLWLMGQPFQQVCLATCIGIIGLLVAAFSTHDKIIRNGAYNILMPALPLLVYLCVLAYPAKKSKRTPNISRAVPLDVI